MKEGLWCSSTWEAITNQRCKEGWTIGHIGPYGVIEQFNAVVYRLDLSVEFKHVCSSYLTWVSKYLLGNTTVAISGRGGELIVIISFVITEGVLCMKSV